jgi:hypothetical protein
VSAIDEAGIRDGQGKGRTVSLPLGVILDYQENGPESPKLPAGLP